MTSEREDDQLIFQFVGCDGPEKPALEPEDDSLLDFNASPSVEEESEEEAWAPAPAVAIEETVAASEPAAEAAISPDSIPEPVHSEPVAASVAAGFEPAAEEVASTEAEVEIEETAPSAVQEEPAEAVAEPEPVPETPAVAAAPQEEPKSAEPVVEELPKALKAADIRRAALAWMAKQSPTALAAKVPTRLKRFYASVAAFWSEPGRRKKLLKPQRTAIIEIRVDREECFAESARRNEILPALREAKAKKVELEAVIRGTEPQLKDSDQLFSEVESWNYAASANREYRRALKHIEELEHALNKGSKFERIRQGHVANELYLAVPDGSVHPYELADGWGLIYITPDLDAKLVKPAEFKECPEDNMMHLAQNIGASALRDVLFSNGVHLASDGTISVMAPPRRRRPQARA